MFWGLPLDLTVCTGSQQSPKLAFSSYHRAKAGRELAVTRIEFGNSSDAEASPVVVRRMSEKEPQIHPR